MTNMSRHSLRVYSGPFRVELVGLGELDLPERRVDAHSLTSVHPDHTPRNSSNNPSARSVVTFITWTSSRRQAGAPSHAPMHSANSSVIRPSGVVCPQRTPS